MHFTISQDRKHSLLKVTCNLSHKKIITNIQLSDHQFDSILRKKSWLFSCQW